MREEGVLLLEEATVNEVATGPLQGAALWDSSWRSALHWSWSGLRLPSQL